jgi:glycosyltransferase involved in cell wall biosynthesis
MTNAESGFKPSYLWPNPAFPFRLYYESSRLRIFIIENVSHNWAWLSSYSTRIRATDFFLVISGWYHSEWLADQAWKTISSLELSIKNFYFLFNDEFEKSNLQAKGFRGDVVNQNAWLDENLTMKPLDVPKIYDAIYVGRRSAFKRHELAGKVKKLAIVSGNNHGNNVAPIPSALYVNPEPLSSSQVCEKINQSRCGLILSAEEGACFASSEYLLCGIPVVSTHSKGGRDVWYDDYNSIVCDPDPVQISDAVAYFNSHPRDPFEIRSRHVKKACEYRLRFIAVIKELFWENGIRDIDPSRYFYDNFIHKMRGSIVPDFDSLFPAPLD